MKKLILESLLLLGVAAVLFYLFALFEPTLVDTLVIIGRTFALRWLQRPLWSFVTILGVVAFIGMNRYGRFCRAVRDPIKAAWWRAWARWSLWPMPLRAASSAGVIGCCAGLLWITSSRLATIIVLWEIVKKLYYVLADRMILQGMYWLHVEYWKNRFLHRNPWLWKRLRAPRHYLAAMLRELERKREARQLRQLQKEDQDKST